MLRIGPVRFSRHGVEPSPVKILQVPATPGTLALPAEVFLPLPTSRRHACHFARKPVQLSTIVFEPFP